MSDRSQFALAIRGRLGNYSGVVAAGGVSQTLLAANDFWNYIFIQNPSDQNESLFINFTTAASTSLANSIELLPGQSWWRAAPGYVPNDQINITAATINHPFVCKAY